MRSRLMARVCSLLLAVTGSAGLLPGIASGAPIVGSPNTATADPPIAVPSTTPCVVPLFAQLTFADFSPKLFSYAPPAACPGPWAKVVLAADFSVTAGRQFDRTASIWLGGANLYFGTTAEPSRTVSPTWHVENDLTDYGGLFATPEPGMVQLDNLVNATFTGVLSGSAELRFYPAEPHTPAPPAADLVLPLSAGPTVVRSAWRPRRARWRGPSRCRPTSSARISMSMLRASLVTSSGTRVFPTT